MWAKTQALPSQFACLQVPAITTILFSTDIEPFVFKILLYPHPETSRRYTYFSVAWVFIKPSHEVSKLYTREFIQQIHHGLCSVCTIISLIWDLKIKGNYMVWYFNGLLWKPEMAFQGLRQVIFLFNEVIRSHSAMTGRTITASLVTTSAVTHSHMANSPWQRWS